MTPQNANATATVLAAAAKTIYLPAPTTTVWDDAPPPYINSSSGTLSLVNVALVCSNVLVISFVGFNRLVAVPLFTSAFASFANALDWYGWLAIPTFSAPERRIAIIMSNVFYTFMDSTVSLYSFFLLEKILSGARRRIYLVVFIILSVSVVAIRVAAIVVLDRYATSPDAEGPAIGVLEDKLVESFMVLLAVLECWSAFFLIRTFYSAKKQTAAFGGGGVSTTGMWSGLARSSELRVSLIAALTVIRLICFRSWDAPQIMKDLDGFAYVMINCYPLLLQLDLLSAKLLKLKAAAEYGGHRRVEAVRIDGQQPGYIDAVRHAEPDCLSVGSPESLLHAEAVSGRGTPGSSLNAEFHYYGVKSRNDSTAGVALEEFGPKNGLNSMSRHHA